MNRINRTSDEVYDEWLVTRCQQRDSAAWEEFVVRWSDRLLYYLRRLISDEQDARSALQDVWLHAFRGICSLRDGTRLAPWLYTIARRTAMTHFRRDYYCREESASDWIDGSVDAADDQLLQENAELVHYGLGRLGIREREILTLFFLQDLTVKEIGTMLGIPAGTVKSRLFKARGDLRRVLDQESARHER